MLMWSGKGTRGATYGNAAAAAGRFLVVTAVVLALRSLHTFHWRADALDGKEIIDYHDRLGPPAIIVALLVALGWSVAHAMHWVPVPASALRPLGR